MPEDWLISTMYATKRRRRTVKSVKAPAKDPPKSNPSKRHRERLNGELDHLASLLPFEQSVISKLDKLSILRLAVSFLRTKSFFQSVIPARYGIESHLMSRSHLFHEPGFSEGESILQALYGFLFVVTCDGEVFFASRTVEQYLGFHQSDIIHQSVMELIHSEDREEFKRQLSWNSLLPSEKTGMPLHEALMTENVQHLHRSFTVRFRCLLDNTSGFITLEINGFIRILHGQSHRNEEPQLALFATCSPFGPLSLFDIPSREMTFKTKHKMDFSPVTMDARGKSIFGHIDQELAALSGYDLIHPDDLNYFSSAHQELIKTGSSGLIAYRWQTKHLHWLWLQSSCKVIYKNSKPDFIICTHRQLTEDEGQDLYGKRGNEFKLPYPLLDIDMCSGFGFSDDEISIKSKPKSSKKKSNNASANGLAGTAIGTNGLTPTTKECGGGSAGGGGGSGSKKSRKSSANCISNSIQSYPSYPTGFPAYDGGGEYKLPEIVYPYSGNGFGFDSELYRTQSYGTFASSFYPTTADAYRMDVDKHSVSNPYFLDAHRQYQHPGLSYGSNGYSDFVMSSKYSYDVPKYGFDSYSLDLGKRMDGSDISVFDTPDIRSRYNSVASEDHSSMSAMNVPQPHPTHNQYHHSSHHSPHHHHHHHHQQQPHTSISTHSHNRYVAPRLNTSSFDSVDLRQSSGMMGVNSFMNPIEATVAPPCVSAHAPSLFKPVAPSAIDPASTLIVKDQHTNHNKYSLSPLCSTNSHSHNPSISTDLIPSIPLPPLPHSSVIKSTGQPDPAAASQQELHNHCSPPPIPIPNGDCLTSYSHSSSNSWSACVKSPDVTCCQTSSASSLLTSVHCNDVTSNSSMPQNGHRLTNICRMNSSPLDSIRDEKSVDSQIRLPENKDQAVTGIRVSVVKPSSWLHGYNHNNNSNANNNNNSTNNGNNTNESNNCNTNNNTIGSTDNVIINTNNNINNINNNSSLLPFHERDWVDNSSSFYGKSSRVLFPDSCHLVKSLNIKPYDRGDNPLLSFSEMTHTLMGSTH